MAFLVLFDVISQVLVILLIFGVFSGLLATCCYDSTSLPVLQSSAVDRLRFLGEVGCDRVPKSVVGDFTCTRVDSILVHVELRIAFLRLASHNLVVLLFVGLLRDLAADSVVVSSGCSLVELDVVQLDLADIGVLDLVGHPAFLDFFERLLVEVLGRIVG